VGSQICIRESHLAESARQRLTARLGQRLRLNASAAENAPLGKKVETRSAAFTLAAATAERVRGNARRYDESASGAWYLNTPRLIADDQQRTVWRWDNTDPFGGNPPDENPSGLGTFEFPLRFPGQYADRETGLHHNYSRDEDPSIGRFIESDPIGLGGGVNTYAYVRGNPLKLTDVYGLATCGRPGGSDYIVPDNPGYPFSDCCKDHDECYEDCRPDVTKDQCDGNFRKCLDRKCRPYGGHWFACGLLANVYNYFATQTGASMIAFAESRTSQKCMRCPPQSK
jgi:RHS repeat-associated protein